MSDFVEVSFKKENTFEYILSIQVSLNGFSFSVCDPKNNKILVFKSTTLKISSNTLIARRFKEWIQSEELLLNPFQNTRVIIFGNKFTLVPRAFHKNDLNSELAHILFKESNNFQFAENLVGKLEAKLIFALPNGLNETISEILGQCEIIHPLKTVINSLPDSANTNSLVLLFNNNDLYLLLSKNNTLLLANSFRINHINDVVYFVLSTLQQLNVKAKETNLYSAGKSIFEPATKSSLNNYFTTCKTLTSPHLNENSTLSDKIISENITLFL